MITTRVWLGKEVFEEEFKVWLTWSFAAGVVIRSVEFGIDFIKSSYLLQKEGQARVAELERAATQLQAQHTEAGTPEHQISVARQTLGKQPVFEYQGARFIRRPIDLRDNTLGDKEYADSELPRLVVNVGVALAKFYYRPDVGVEPWLSVRAHIIFHDAYGETTTVNDAMWFKEDDKYKKFQTGDSHELIVGLIPKGSEDKLLTYEHSMEAHDPVFTKTRGLTAEHLAPEIQDIQGSAFTFSVSLVGKKSDQVIVTRNFNFKLNLAPEPKLEELRSDLQNTLSGTSAKVQINRARIREELQPLLEEGKKLEREVNKHPTGSVREQFAISRGLDSMCSTWAEQVKRVIERCLGEEYLTRFYSQDEQAGAYWPAKLKGRVIELEKIVSELPD